MNKPKVSVIVPVYNTEKYLENCLKSLANQTLSDIEIVVIDDGSTDSSPQIIKRFCEEYPEKFVFESQENGGQASARNRALKLCSGEYVGFLDSDDFVRENMFEKMYEKAQKNDADYVACGYTDITYENGKEVELAHYVASKVALKTKDLFFGALVSPFLHLYRREILEKSGVFFPEGIIYEDTAFYLNLVPYIKKIQVIEEPLAYRVRRRNSTTTTFNPIKVAQIFPVIDESLDYYKKHDLWDEYKDPLTYFCVKVLLCSSMQRICKVGDGAARRELVDKTMMYLNEKFPDYRKNPYFKNGALSVYIRSFNKATAGLYTTLFRVKSKFEKQYS
jgi:hypothetical protein